jgi:hypothetical protein
VTTIDPRSRLTTAMQPQLAALRDGVRIRRGVSTTGAPPRADSIGCGRSAFAERIRAISAQDPDRPQKAVRVYLEGELVREFGDALLNDAAFPRMLDAVQQQMQADAPSAAAVHALGGFLLEGSQS